MASGRPPVHGTKKLKGELKIMGFTRSDFDPALYWRITEDGEILLVHTYVDDMMVVSVCERDETVTVAGLRRVFTMTDMEFPDMFVGVDVEKSGGGSEPLIYYLHQATFIAKTIRDLDIDPATLLSTLLPMSNDHAISPELDETLYLDKKSHELYRSLVGSLLYISTCTRPDVSYAVNILCRYSLHPGKKHLLLAKQVLRYLHGTSRMGLRYSSAEPLEIMAYADSDYASCTVTRRSTTGYAFMVAGAAVSWNCKRQHTVAVSTMEAEYQAAGAAARDGTWLQRLLMELSHTFKPLDLKGDNTACALLAKNHMVTDRSKHIDVVYHFVREKVENGDMTVTQIATVDNTADIFTKPLKKDLFLKHRNGLGLVLVPTKAGAGGVGGATVGANVAPVMMKRKKRKAKTSERAV